MRCVIYLRVSTREQAEHGEGEEGFSIPAQREACVRHVRDKDWDLIDEYVDRGSRRARADRPQLQEMLARIAEDGDVDAVVVHKIDRLARNMEDHVAIRALLRRRSVTLVSVTENLEETASGRLVEGIHALMAEFYSANLASEIKKGMSQKAKIGGWPHSAPLGYTNVRETIGRPPGRPHRRRPRTRPAHHRRLRVVRDRASGPSNASSPSSTTAGCATGAAATAPMPPSASPRWPTFLSNKAYAGIVSWEGSSTPACTSRSPTPPRSTGSKTSSPPERHAGRGSAAQPLPEGHAVLRGVRPGPVVPAYPRAATSTSTASARRTGTRPAAKEPYMAAGDLEAQVEQLYERIQLPKSLAQAATRRAGGRDHRPPTSQRRRARVLDAQARQG